MQSGTLTSVTDRLYTEHLNRNINGAGRIIQDRATGKKALRSLAKWSATAGSYSGESLGMLAVRIFLLAAECFYGLSIEKQGGNNVSCNNMGALHTFVKKSKKRVPTSSSNVDVKRALREVNRRANNKYRLEHMRGHRDRTNRFRNLSLEAKLNVKYNRTSKRAVKGSRTINLREGKQQLLLENAYVFGGGRGKHQI
jgi:hypothetical protein